MYDISKESAESKKQIEIRGRYLMMACDIEFSLLCIIMYSSPDPYNQQRLGQFSDMHMSEKINNAICDIKKHNYNYYLEFKPTFDGLEEFRIVRNDMAHCVGMFPKAPDLSVFKIDFIDKEDKKDKTNKNEWFKYKEYTETYILESLERFKQINWRLFNLWMRLKAEFDSGTKNPPLIHPNSGTTY